MSWTRKICRCLPSDPLKRRNGPGDRGACSLSNRRKGARPHLDQCGRPGGILYKPQVMNRKWEPSEILFRALAVCVLTGLVVRSSLGAPLVTPSLQTRSEESLPARHSPSLVTSPDLSGMDEVVQRQLREAQSHLAAVTRERGVTKRKLAEAYGSLGELYHAYGLDPSA